MMKTLTISMGSRKPSEDEDGQNSLEDLTSVSINRDPSFFSDKDNTFRADLHRVSVMSTLPVDIAINAYICLLIPKKDSSIRKSWCLAC